MAVFATRNAVVLLQLLLVVALGLVAASEVPPAWVPRISGAQMMYAPTDVGVKYM